MFLRLSEGEEEWQQRWMERNKLDLRGERGGGGISSHELSAAS